MSELVHNTEIVHSLRKAVDQCTLPHVPESVREVIQTNAWQSRYECGKVWRFETFYDFITMPIIKGGCGWEPEKVTTLLRKSGDDEALAMWNMALNAKAAAGIAAQSQATQRAVGRPKIGSNAQNDGPNLGRNTAKAERRLRKHRPDLHQRVLNGELSWNAAMVEGGFRKKPTCKREQMPTLQFSQETEFEILPVVFAALDLLEKDIKLAPTRETLLVLLDAAKQIHNRAGICWVEAETKLGKELAGVPKGVGDKRQAAR